MEAKLARDPGHFNRIELCFAYVLVGRHEAERLHAELLRMNEQARAAGLVNWGYEEFVASLHAIEGNREAMLERLERGLEIGLVASSLIKIAPWYDPYQDDPEFRAVIAELEARQARMRNSLRVEGL